jgi:hypothetical protein
MDYSELRNVYHTALTRISSQDHLQLGKLENMAFDVACEKGYFQEEMRSDFNRQHRLQITDLFWESLISGIVGIGADEANPNLPFFHITDFGRDCIQKGEISVYDPTGLISDLRSKVPDLDGILEEYLREALLCFGRNCLKASTVMIGCAAERLFLMIVDAFKEYFADQNERARFERAIDGRPIKRILDQFQNRIERIGVELRQSTRRDDWDTVVSGIFNLIRRHRNEAGHPTGISIEKETVLSLILLFREYCKSGYTLKNHFRRSKSQIL